MSEAAPVQFQCLMVGLPGTGKTTFLAALWHVVKSNEVSGSLQLEKREGDQEYLNRIADQWSKCTELERTPLGDELESTVLLCDPANGGVVRLRIPDMSGELFRSHWEARKCTIPFKELVCQAEGCLLFIHPEKVTGTLWIADANAIYEQWAGGESEEGDEVEKTDGIGWEASNTPTQVQLVEQLQFLTELTGRGLRLVVIVSAWDLIAENVTPSEWVEQQLPLLWQFLQANPTQFHSCIMGVSAQGGKTTNAVTLLEYLNASDRIRIHAPDVQGNDITHPIRWLMARTHDEPNS